MTCIKSVFFASTLFIIAGCNSIKKTSPVTEILEIASFKKTCEGVGQSQCLQIREEGQLNWAYFYNSIEGFEYTPGYKYTIEVQKETVGPKTTPADASSFKYTLVKQLRKQKEPTIKLHDIWVVKTIHNEPITQAQISLELQINTSKIFGNDSCNNFFGAIEQVNDNNLQFGLLGRTKKLCQDMAVPNLFYDTMQEVTGYRIERLYLYLLNSNDEEIMKLLKVD